MKIQFVLMVSALLISQMSWAENYSLKVTEKGFEPESLTVAAGEDVNLKVIRTTDSTCAKQILVPSKKIKANLPLNKEVTVALGKLPKGEVKFVCGMKMIGGVVVAK